MNRKIVSARHFNSKWSVDGFFKITNGSFFVIIFVAIWLKSWNFPGYRVKIDIKFGELICNTEALKFRLGWNFIAKSYCIIEDTELESKDAATGRRFGEIENCLNEIVRNKMILTPLKLNR